MKTNVFPAHFITVRSSLGVWFVRCSVCGYIGRSYATKVEAENRAKNHRNGADA